MTIGIDLTSLQSGHRMRGIGYTLINFINSLSLETRENHKFIFFCYDDQSGFEDPLSLLDLTNITYEVRYIQPVERPIKFTLPGRLNLIIRVLNQLIAFKNLHAGDSRIKDIADLDVFLQTDQMVSLPAGKFKKAFIAYDLIPYVLEWDYLWTYKTARLKHMPRLAAIRMSMQRRFYLYKLRVNCRRADTVIAISEASKQDFIKYISGVKKKITIIPLGINLPDAKHKSKPPSYHYVSSSWGYLKRPYRFGPEPYLLFVGGADQRRRLDELVIAFNHLRAQGHTLKLVLAGDSMQGPINIATVSIQKSLLESSYLDDIIFMGFVDDNTRDWLYENSLAFIFPSKYEGFGLPVLEAMGYGRPVICYRNAATEEVAGTIPYYVEGAYGIEDAVKLIISQSDKKIEKRVAAGIKEAQRYNWQTTSIQIISELASLSK